MGGNSALKVIERHLPPAAPPRGGHLRASPRAAPGGSAAAPHTTGMHMVADEVATLGRPDPCSRVMAGACRSSLGRGAMVRRGSWNCRRRAGDRGPERTVRRAGRPAGPATGRRRPAATASGSRRRAFARAGRRGLAPGGWRVASGARRRAASAPARWPARGAPSSAQGSRRGGVGAGLPVDGSCGKPSAAVWPEVLGCQSYE